MAFPVYSISVVYSNDRAEAGDFVMVSAGLPSRAQIYEDELERGDD